VIKQLPDLSLNQTTGCRYIAYSVVRYFFEPPALEWYYRYSKIGYEQLQSIICDSCWMFQSVIYSCNHLHEADEISHMLCHAKVSLIWFVHFVDYIQHWVLHANDIMLHTLWLHTVNSCGG